MSLYKVIEMQGYSTDHEGTRTPLMTKGTPDNPSKAYQRVTFAPILPKGMDIATTPREILAMVAGYAPHVSEQVERNIFEWDKLSLTKGGVVNGKQSTLDVNGDYTFPGRDGEAITTSKITVFAIGNENPVSIANRRLAEYGVTVFDPETNKATTYTKREKPEVAERIA